MAEQTVGESVDENEKTDQLGTEAAADNGRSFSQADVDRIVQERLARVKTMPPSDYADLQASAKKLADLEEANKTELEKAVARAEKAESDRAASETRAQESALRAAIVAEAAKAGRKVTDPEATVTFLTGPDRELLNLDENGNPSDIAKAMDTLLERRAYLVAPQGGSRGNADQGARTGGANQLTRGDLESMSPEAIAQAEKEGRLANLLGVT